MGQRRREPLPVVACQAPQLRRGRQHELHVPGGRIVEVSSESKCVGASGGACIHSLARPAPLSSSAPARALPPPFPPTLLASLPEAQGGGTSWKEAAAEAAR